MSESQAWFKMLRISNAPTIISNVMVGIAIAIQSHAIVWADTSISPRLDFLKTPVVISIALLLIYFSGMIFNDANDAEWDKKHRPERPIPQGLIKKKDAWLTASFMLACGVLLSGINRVSLSLAAILAIAVLAYTFIHRWTIPAIIFMALSRSLVYAVTVSAILPSPLTGNLIGCCIAIGVYTALLTIIGRCEHEAKAKRAWLVPLMAISPIIPLIMYGNPHEIWWIMLIVFLVWLSMSWKNFRQPNINITDGMHKLLAGFCLLDCLLIALIGEISIMIVSLICFILTVAAHRKVIGT